MEHPEKEWLAAYRKGDLEALASLVEHFRRPLFSYIHRMVDNHADAEEVFQEVWLRVVRNFSGYKDRSFISWLFRIAHNLVVDRVRKDGRKDELTPIDGEDVYEARVSDQEALPSEQAADADLGLRIREAAARLPVEQREIFILRTYSQLSFKEIAGMKGISINTALARMQYALSKLRTMLEDDYKQLQD